MRKTVLSEGGADSFSNVSEGTKMQISRWMKTAAVAAMVSAALTGCGEDKKAEAPKTIGIVQLVEHDALDAANRGITDALKERGVTMEIDRQNAQADQSNLRNIAQRFVSHNYPLIFAIATPAAQTVANATSTTPIVATAVTDFAVAKLVKDNNTPGTNVTGSSDMNPIAAQTELLLKLVPNAKTVGTIYNSSEINSQLQIDILRKELEKHGVALAEATISSVNDIQQAAQSLVGKVDVMYVPTDNVVASSMPTLYRVTQAAKLAVVAGEAGMVRSGATATVAVDYYNLGKIAGNMGADILEGKAKPQDMPIRYQTEFKVVLNESVVKELGLTVPEDVAKNVTWVK